MIHQCKKFRVFIKDDFTCTYCAKPMSPKTKLTVDHIVPKAKGGTNAYSNITTACQCCNGKKADMLLTDFIRKFKIKITPKIAELL